MSIDRDEEIVAAYAAGDDVEQIGRRFGISAEQVQQIVAAQTGAQAATPLPVPGAAPPRRTPLAITGIALMALGVAGPCTVGAGWLAVYYLSETEYPVASWQYGNIAAGLSGICAGSVLATIGLVLLLVSRSRQR